MRLRTSFAGRPASAGASLRALLRPVLSCLTLITLAGATSARADVVPLDLSGGFNYDAYISSAESSHALTYNPPANWGLGSRMVSSVFGEHSAGATGRNYAWDDQTTSGLPATGELSTAYGDFQLSTVRDAEPSGGYVQGPTGSPPTLPLAGNALRVHRPHSGSTGSPSAVASAALPLAQQGTYDSINFLVSGNNGKVLIYADYDDGGGGVDTQLIYESPGTPKTTGETGFPEVVSSSATNPDLVPALTMSKYWGQSSNYSNIVNGTATLWTFDEPIALDPAKTLLGVTLAIYDADTWKSRTAVIYAASANAVSTRPTVHVDAVNGNDTSGDGSAGAPYQSMAKVLTVITGGEDVIIHDGSYGNVTINKGGNLYSDWVVFKAAPGAAPELGKFTLAGPSGPQNQTGGYNAYVRLENLILRDGWEANGAKHWALVECLIERIGPWTGSVANIEKTAVAFRNGTDILIEGCEITNTGTGIAGRGHEVIIRGCHIHNGTHDGIRVTGFWNSVVEDNLIHTFDDGVTDAEASWSRHCDLIHIFIPGPGLDGWENNNVVFRNNILFDTESQAVQFNNYLGRPELWNKNITFENNIFGPSKANLFNNAEPTEGLIIRHNTVVYVPGGRTLGRWTLSNHTMRIGASTGVEIYNNLLFNANIDSQAQVDLFNWNHLQSSPSNPPIGVDDTRAYGRFIELGVDAQFVDAQAFDGAVQSTSPVINAGTAAFAPTALLPDDIAGTLRDSIPDIGAWEYPGLTPGSEPLPTIYNDTKTVFVDDFEDGSYTDVDDWLNDVGQQGLSWYRPETVNAKFKVITNTTGTWRNCLRSPTGASGVQRQPWLFTHQGSNWAEYDFSFKAANGYMVSGTGPLVLATDEDNCYWLDIGRDAGNLIRRMNGVQTTLAGSSVLRLPHSGERLYKISVRQVSGGIEFSVDVGNNGSVDFTYTDTDANAKALFTAGGVGVHENSAQVNHGVSFDDFRVDVVTFAP